jgi:hypothetical protein
MIRQLYVWISNLFIKIQFPIKDVIWPSRRWNRKRTNYVDLSG